MRLRAAIVSLALAGCGMPASQIRPDSGSPAYQVDALQCDYESSSATAGYGSGQNTARTSGGAAAQGMATGMAQGMARNDLFVKCMRAKYAQRAEAGAARPAQQDREAIARELGLIPYEGKVLFPPK